MLATVNASYLAWVTASELPSKIADKDSVSSCDCHVLTFFSEVPANLQQAFIKEMGVSMDAVLGVAEGFSELADVNMPLLGLQILGLHRVAPNVNFSNWLIPGMKFRTEFCMR